MANKDKDSYIEVDVVTISKDEYDELEDCYGGFCLKCKEFCFDGCEPDAMNYECPECGKRAVMGIESAFLMGYVKVKFDE